MMKLTPCIMPNHLLLKPSAAKNILSTLQLQAVSGVVHSAHGCITMYLGGAVCSSRQSGGVTDSRHAQCDAFQKFSAVSTGLKLILTGVLLVALVQFELRFIPH